MKFTKEKRDLIFNKFRGYCAYCGCELKRSSFTVDHIKPYRRKASPEEIEEYGRGGNNIENLNPSCLSCNCSKSTFSIEKWRRELSLKHGRLLKQESSYRIINRFGLVKISNDVVFYFEKEVNNG